MVHSGALIVSCFAPPLCSSLQLALSGRRCSPSASWGCTSRSYWRLAGSSELKAQTSGFGYRLRTCPIVNGMRVIGLQVSSSRQQHITRTIFFAPILSRCDHVSLWTDYASLICYSFMPSSPLVFRLLSICDDLYRARAEGNLELEEALFWTLIRIYRSPNLLMEYTKGDKID